MLYKIILKPTVKNEFRVASVKFRGLETLLLFDDDNEVEKAMEGFPAISMAVRLTEEVFQELLQWTTCSHAVVNQAHETFAPISCFLR